MVVAFELFLGLFAAFLDHFLLHAWNNDVGNRPRDTCVGRVAESERLNFVENRGDAVEAVVCDEVLHQCAHALVGDFFVEVREVARKDGVEEKASDGRLKHFALVLRVLLVLGREHFYFRAQINGTEIVCGNRGVGRRKCAPLAFQTVYGLCHPVAAQDDIEELGCDDDVTASRLQDVLVGGHHHARFHLSGFGERHVDGHRVAVEVGVVGGTDERMHLDGVTFNEDRAERLDGLAVQGRRAVQKHVLVFNRLFEDRPHFRCFVFDKTTCSADVVGEFACKQALNDERAEEFEHHVLRQTAFVESEVRTDDDDGATRVVHAFAEEVLTQIAVLTLEVVGEGFERTAAATEDTKHARAAAHRVVEERINGLLKNTFFVAENDFGSVDGEQSLETVVTVDDAAVEVVEVRRRVAASFERDHRAECGRDDGETGHEHPLGAHTCALQALGEAEALAEFVAVCGTRILVLLLHLLDEDVDVDIFQNAVEGFRADGGTEHRAVFHREEVVRSFVEDDADADGLNLLLGLGGALFQIGLYLGGRGGLVLGREFVFELLEQALALLFIDVRDDVAREVDDFLHFRGREAEHESDTGRNTTEKPDVRDGGREVDVAHALAAHDGARNFHATFLTNDAAETDATVLTAVTFVILFGSEYALVEEAVFFRALRAVVDGLGLGDFAEAPFEHTVRRGEPHCDCFEILRNDVFLFCCHSVFD